MKNRTLFVRSLFSMVILLLAINLSSQSTVDVTKGGRYFMDGKRLKTKDLTRLYTSPSTLPDWQIAKQSKVGADWFGFIGGFGLGWAVGYAVNPPDYSHHFISAAEREKKKNTAATFAVVMLGTGIVSTIASIPYARRYKRHSHAAAVQYNKDLKTTSISPPYLRIGGGESGLSLSYNF